MIARKLVLSHKENTWEFGEILNLTKYHESYFLPDLMFHNVWRVCLQHNGCSSHPPNHYTSTIISFFQYASHLTPLYKEQIRNYTSCSFLAKMANFILSTNTTRNRLNAYVVIKLSKLKLRNPKRKKKPNSKFHIQLLNWFPLRPL